MLKDQFVRFCLIAIVLLLGLITLRLSPPQTVKAAGASSCLIENVTGHSPEADAKITATCTQRLAQGWRLHSLVTSMGNTFFVWEK